MMKLYSRCLRLSSFIVGLIIFTSGGAGAYYYPESHTPPGNPPTYNPIDSSYFLGLPDIPFPPPDSGGIYVYYDQGRWHFVNHIYSQGGSFEQFHGSVLTVLSQPPEPGVNVIISGFELWTDTTSNLCLKQNDRWGWVQWDTNLYEIWWDVTTREYKNQTGDPNDILQLIVDGCAIDINLWSADHSRLFGPDQIFLGGDRIPLNTIPEYADTYIGLSDPYQSQAGEDPLSDPNITIFTSKNLPGASYNAFGEIQVTDSYSCDSAYGARYAGAFAYEGNGIQFSSNCQAPQQDFPELLLNFDSSAFACADDSLCLTATGTSPNTGETLILTLLQGPITFDPITAVGQIDTTVCFQPDTSGSYRFIWRLEDSGGRAVVDTADLLVSVNSPPYVMSAEDFPLSLCREETVCFQSTADDSNFNIASVTVNFGIYDDANDRVCFVAETAGLYTIITTAIDSCGVTDSDTTIVTVKINAPPVVSLGEDKDAGCTAGLVCIDASVSDDNLHFVSSSIGVYDSAACQVCFVPDSAGVYTVILQAFDDCDLTDSDTAYVTVRPGNAPAISNFNDTTVYICSPQYICLAPDISDIDNDIQSISLNIGTYDTGQVCFVPYTAGEYELILTVVDSCGSTVIDTAVVMVLTDQGIQLTGPPDTSVFLCQPDTLCFPIGGIPEGAEVIVGGTGVWWDAQTESVCFYSTCCLENIITVTVVTACGYEFSSSFTVNVRTNSAPLAILPQDSTIVQCVFEEICLPVGVADVDGNLMDVQVSGAIYDSYRGEACFLPDSSGTYYISVTATDSCGASDSDIFAITVILNEEPVITYEPIDTPITQCTPSEICIPVNISDADGNLIDVSVVGGTYDEQNNLICLSPTEFGVICAQVTATDACGLTATVEICITVEQGEFVTIECPVGQPPTYQLCSEGEVCIPLEILGNEFTVTTNGGFWANGQLCFNADTSGIYAVLVIAEAQCNADTCLIMVPVEILEPVRVDCPADTIEFLCAPDTMCYDFTVSASADSVVVSAPAYISGSQVCVPLLQPGAQTITLTAFGQCGTDSCSFTVQTIFNTPPVINFLTADTTIIACTFNEICIPVEYSDADGNIIDVKSSLGIVGDISVCFTPDSFGVYTMIVTAADSCGEMGADTLTITLQQGSMANILCPTGTRQATVCRPDMVCIVVPITGADSIKILPDGFYKAASAEVCIPVDSSGIYEITVIASASCGNDTCTFLLEVTRGAPPVISCPVSVDTLLCIAEPTTLCIPVEVTGADVVVTVSPEGVYDSGFVCIPITQAGQFEISVVADGACGVDSCTIELNITADQAPTLTLPASTLTFERCPNDTFLICIDGIFATDTESQPTISILCGQAQFEAVRPDSGSICFLPDSFGIFEFCVIADDGCQIDSSSLFVEVLLRTDCDVCVRLEIDGGDCSPVGVITDVAINIGTNDLIGDFDLLISYDASVMSFQTATTEGTAIESWEYFTWSLNSAACGIACPSGLIRFIGIADQNDGPIHPPDSAFNPEGPLVFLRFLISSNQNLAGQFLPIRWAWYDCLDNSLSGKSGGDLFIDTRIFNPGRILLWDEADDINYPEASRPFGLGAPDDCLDGQTINTPVRCVELHNGGICINPSNGTNRRGDINLNGLAYEIADAVLFTNFFIRGLGVFDVDRERQIAATDVNADGLVLSVADLSYLIRVIVGDAPAIPKVDPHSQSARIRSKRDGTTFEILAETSHGIGVALFVIKVGDGAVIGEPRLLDDAGQMDMIYGNTDGELRLLIYNIGSGEIQAGDVSLIEIPVDGDGELRIAQIDLADFYGQPYTVVSGTTNLPGNFELKQNYPNPFNPTTAINFMLPQAVSWAVRIYNVEGRLVREYTGENEAGQYEIIWDGRNSAGQSIASGLYLYRLDAGSFSQTRKMILLK